MADELTDSELLQRYATGRDEAAFAALVQRHLPLVYGAALRQLNVPTLAGEVAQSVFITLARRAVWLTRHPSLAGWLYRTAVHLAQHQARTENRRRQREQTAVELATLMKVDESLLANLTPVLDEVLLELAAADREALLLRFFAHKSLREVGAALGIREDAAQKRVTKALDALTDRFRRRGFRVAGAMVVTLVLQQSAASAVPAGLAVLTTQAALGAGAVTSLGSLALPITKLMTLTKLQTAALCLVIAAVPVGYEWNAQNRAFAVNRDLNRQLAALETDAQAGEQNRARAERTVAELESRLTTPGPVQAMATGAARPKALANLYVWDENSPYVRLPKSVLGQVRLAPFAMRTARDGKVERYQLPPLATDGKPQPALEAGLGLSASETEKFRAICQASFAQLQNLATSHSQLTEEPFLDGKAMKLNTAAFPGEGAQVRDQFRQQLTDLLGPERTEAFWQQASSVFSDSLNDFGANSRELRLIRRPNQPLNYQQTYQGAGSIGELSQRNGLPFPPLLQPYADAWVQEAAAQSGQQPPQ